MRSDELSCPETLGARCHVLVTVLENAGHIINYLLQLRVEIQDILQKFMRLVSPFPIYFSPRSQYRDGHGFFSSTISRVFVLHYASCEHEKIFPPTA